VPGRPRGNKVRGVRERVLNRDGWRCRDCGVRLTAIPDRPNSAHVAHLTAHVDGGPYVESNLYASCRECNLANGARPRPEVST
jgi:hypothetical protein